MVGFNRLSDWTLICPNFQLSGLYFPSFVSYGSRKKCVFFSGPATKRGGGVRAWPLRENTVFWSSKKILEKNLWQLSSRGGGGKATEKRPLFFFEKGGSTVTRLSSFKNVSSCGSLSAFYVHRSGSAWKKFVW